MRGYKNKRTTLVMTGSSVLYNLKPEMLVRIGFLGLNRHGIAR